MRFRPGRASPTAPAGKGLAGGAGELVAMRRKQVKPGIGSNGRVSGWCQLALKVFLYTCGAAIGGLCAAFGIGLLTAAPVSGRATGTRPEDQPSKDRP